MAAREVLDRLLGKAKVAVAIEPEQQPTPEETMAELQAFVAANPEVVELLHQAEAGATP